MMTGIQQKYSQKKGRKSLMMKIISIQDRLLCQDSKTIAKPQRRLLIVSVKIPESTAVESIERIWRKARMVWSRSAPPNERISEKWKKHGKLLSRNPVDEGDT